MIARVATGRQQAEEDGLDWRVSMDMPAERSKPLPFLGLECFERQGRFPVVIGTEDLNISRGLELVSRTLII